jgi:hypothetical protein
MLGCADTAGRGPRPEATSRCRRPVTVTAACQCVATVIEIRDRGCVLPASAARRGESLERLRGPRGRRHVTVVTVHDRISAVLHDRISAVLHRTSPPYSIS